MRTFVCLSAFLGLAVFLTIHYSFWLSVGIIYSGGMFLVVVIAFTTKRRRVSASRSTAFNDGKGQLIADGQTVSDDLKAA